jgi:hypothetical protein
MSKGWRIIGAIVLVLVLLGAICIGVGFMTGGDVADIYSTLDLRYNLSGRWEQYSQWAVTSFNNIVEGVRGLW